MSRPLYIAMFLHERVSHLRNTGCGAAGARKKIHKYPFGELAIAG